MERSTGAQPLVHCYYKNFCYNKINLPIKQVPGFRRKEGAAVIDTSKISDYLKQMRLNNNLTQLNVADRLGLTPQAVSKWERYESMPDITLLPEIAQMYGITVEDILTAGKAESDNDLADIMQVLNTFIDERLFDKVLREFEKTKSVRDLRIPIDIFMALNGRQKDILLELLLDMDDYVLVIDDIMQYLNMAQREKLIMYVAENGDYDVLEILIPFMTRTVRTEVVILLLKAEKFDFMEEMLLFLNHEQKNLIIHYFMDNGLNFEVLENFMPFFDKAQRKLITDREVTP